MSSRRGQMGITLRRIALVGCAVSLMACTTMTRKHGFVPLPEDLDQMTVGVTTRDETLALVGPPTTTGATESNTLYYVQSERELFGPFEPRVTKREVLAVRFTPGGVLSNIERYGLEDGRVVVLSRRITDDGIADVTFIGQLLGAIGNIDAGALIDGPVSGVDT